ncbi:MAG: T9SS type A sorting domain-containing protein, partial [Saprospiraceae bacterium]|nr:T9SS type A sorting domain-containing protein [Saprospiraceae bacterium]
TVCGYNLDCSGTVTISQSVSDDCTPGSLLVVNFKVDVNDDGTYDYLGSNQSQYPYPNPGNLPIVNANYTETPIGFDITIDGLSLPVGQHSVFWAAEDLCSNVATCTSLLTVEDCKLPTPKAINGLVVETMPATQSITLPAEWFSADSYDNCGLQNLWVASPSGGVGQTTPPAGAGPTVTFNCDDLGTNTVDLWAQDINGNWDYVITYVIVQDNQGACGVAMGDIAGIVESEIGEAAQNVVMRLTGAEEEEAYTELAGIYDFPQLPLDQNYTVTPDHDFDLREGVTTLDLVLISRHLVGLESLASPYKIIAADVNNDGWVTAFDLIDLQRVILYMLDAFPNNTSFRFIDANFNFENELNPFSSTFPEACYINGLTSAEIVDFIAVKVGDVNHSAQLNELSTAGHRSFIGNFPLGIMDKALEKGERAELVVTSNSSKELLGMQASLDLGEDIELIQVKDPVEGLVSSVKNNSINLSWTAPEGENVRVGESLLTLEVRAKKATRVNQQLSLSDDRLKAEAYTVGFDHLSLDIQFIDNNANEQKADDLVLLQNQPNPFYSSTEIGFILPQAGEVILNIFDVHGKVVKSIPGKYNKGYQKIILSQNDLNGKGLYYYELSFMDKKLRKKLILVD